MKYKFEITLITYDSKLYGVLLENVPVQNLTYTAESLRLRVEEHLAQYIIVE